MARPWYTWSVQCRWDGGCSWLLLALTLALVGCKDDEGEAATAPMAEEPEELGEVTDELLARRDALLAMRSEIEDERAQLVEKREVLVERGEDTSEIDEKLAALVERDREVDAQQDEFYDKLDDHLAKQRSVVAALAASAGTEGVAAREAAVAAREKELARREERLASRESEMARRESEMAKRWKDSCATTPTTIVQTIDAKGSKYTEKDVEPLLRRARREMSRKGILAADLPPPTRELEREASAAMKERDYRRARLAAQQLLGTVRATRIDKAFIAAKIGRLNQMMKGRNLAGSVQRNVDSLFRDATASYGDGKFGRANKKLNEIYAAIR